LKALIDLSSIPINQLQGTLHSSYKDLSQNLTIMKRIINKLNKMKRNDHLITFNDMILSFNNLLTNSPKIRNRIQRQYPIIVVDEFQDTGKQQWEIIKKITKDKSNLLCAGDDGQTIFTWSDASFERFNHFRKEYPNSKIYPLTENKRSTRWIVSLSNHIMTQSHYSSEKEITCSQKGHRPSIVCNTEPSVLYEYITNRITQLTQPKESKVSLDDIVVCYRFYDHTVTHLMEHLTQSKIPYKVIQDKSKRDRPLIKVIFALIRIIEHPFFSMEDWEPVLLKVEGVGEKNAEKIIEWLKETKLKDTNYPKDLRFKKPLQKLLEFVRIMKQSDLTNPDKLNKIMDFVQYHLKINRSYNEHIQPTLLMLAHQVERLSDIIPKYENRSYPLYYPIIFEPPYPKSYLTLSTVHGIKGKGFHTVFYLGTDDTFYAKHGCFETEETIEEELQLMNVAVTRAEKELHLLFPIDIEDWNNPNVANDIDNPWRFLKNLNENIYTLRTKHVTHFQN